MRRIVLCALLAMSLTACSASKAADPEPLPSAAPSASPSAPAPSPSRTPSPSPTPSETAVPACARSGKFQQAVEAALAQMGAYGPVTVNGVQSEADCAAIKNFQERFGLRPVDGIAGPATHRVAQRLLATDTSRCEAARYGVTACVDLTNQTTWLMRGGTVIYGPTVTRTGMAGFGTPTRDYETEWRTLNDWSKPYQVRLPYGQSFNGDIGSHETTSYLHHAGIGSHGCVNLLHTDAVQYWEQLEEGSSVVVFGHRPGT
jgi:peptidoglycan hydrolase-like protein with peptidoglycan-binding domain